MATHESIWGPRKNVAFDAYFSLRKPSPAGVGDEDEFITTPTLATGDIQVSKDGAAFANVGTLGSEAPASSGVIKQALTADEMNADVVCLRCLDQTGTEEWQEHRLYVYTADLVRSTTPANTLDIDSDGRVDIGSWLGSAVTKSAGNLPDVNVAEVSDDSTAADNLETYCDGTTPIPANMTQISGDATAADNLESYTDGTDKIEVHCSEFSSAFDFSSTMKTSLETATTNALNTAIPGSPVAHSVFQRVKAIDELTESGGSGDLAAILDDTGTSGVAINMSQAYPASPTAGTLGEAWYFTKAAVANKVVRDGTTVTVYKDNASSTLYTRTLNSASNPTQIS